MIPMTAPSAEDEYLAQEDTLLDGGDRDYWLDQLRADKDYVSGDSLGILVFREGEWHHYRVAVEDEGRMRGFSGRPYMVVFEVGVDTLPMVTTNLWYQGVVPTDLLDAFKATTLVARLVQMDYAAVNTTSGIKQKLTGVKGPFG